MKKVAVLIMLCLAPTLAYADETSICQELNDSIEYDMALAKGATDAEVIEYLVDSILVKVKVALVLGCACKD